MRKLEFFLVVLSLVLMSACGGQSSSKTIPGPTQGSGSGSGTLPTTPPSQTPGIPDLSRAVALSLTDNTTYVGLSDLAGMVFPPLVGDALVQLRFIGDPRANSYTAEATVAFEDAQGFWGAKQNSFTGTPYRTSNYVDFITSEGCPSGSSYTSGGVLYCNLSYPLFSLRVVAGIQGDTLYGTVYYRVRQNGETYCWANSNPYLDTVTPCRNYMNPTNSQVKSLGTFRASYSNWNF